jgi:isopenicillin N synthase-like dioxygenase
MAPIAIDDTGDDDAPLSPRNAALYYWGGGGDNGEAHDGVDCNKENHHQASENPFQKKKCSGQENNMTTLWDYTTTSSTFHYSPHNHRSYSHRRRGRHRRPLIRFHLEMDDEDDCNHWMFLRPTSQQIPAPIDNNTSPVATTTTKDDTVAIINNNNNNNDEDDDFNTIPIIDLSQPSATYSTQIGNACKSTGFFYIINHGISQRVMDDVMDISRKLFDLDLESKLDLRNGEDDTAATTSTDETQKKKKKKGYRGYFGIGAEDLDNKDGTRDLANEEEETKEVTITAAPVKGDFKEGYDVGLDNDSHHAFFGRNVWPDEMKHDSIVGFRETLIRYQDELLVLADRLMVAFAMSLNSDAAGSNISVPTDYFLTRTRNPMCTLRLLHYPPSLSKSNSGGGCGAHTDYGLFTILFQDHIGGLQVRNHGRRWIDAKPLRGSFVINVGDMLSHWTQGIYASTVHRVISPASGSGYHRYSVPFFFNPDPEAVVEPLVEKVSSDGSDERCSNKRRSSTALEILNARYKGTFQSDS